MAHIAAISAVKVSLGSPDGNSIVRIIREGEVIPEGIDETLLQSLLDRGLIVEAPDESEAIAETEGAVDDAFDAAVKAEAARIIEADFVPEYEKRVQEAAEKLAADRAAAGNDAPPAAAPAATPAKATAAAKAATK